MAPARSRSSAAETGTATPFKVGGYRLVEFEGLWFLDDHEDRTVSTILDMGNRLWRARTPQGGAATFSIPDGVDNPARYVAEQLVTQTQGPQRP